MSERPGRLVLGNAKVLTCAAGPGERPFNGDVLIEGDRIKAVVPGGIEVTDGSARVIDVRGATVMPGLGDAHTHISWPLDFVFDHAAVARAPEGRHMLDVAAVVRTYIESGYTSLIGAGVLQRHDDLLAKEAVESGLIPGPRIVPSGPMIGQPGTIADGGLMELAADAAGIRAIVARQCDEGVRALKLFLSGDSVVPAHPSHETYMNDEMVQAAVDEAERHGAFVTAHARGAASVALAARNGVRIIHHACFLDEAARRELEKRRGDVWVCPGLHYLWAMVNGHAEPWGITAAELAASGYADELTAQVDALRQLRDIGVPIVAGGDFGHQWTRHGTYAAELQRYVELVGMSALEAIHTATRNIGAVAGVEVGQVREGSLADLLIVDGDPTTDIALLARADRRVAVMKGGSFVYLNAERVL